MSADERAAPIIIIGGGPVGMMLALNLDALGVRSHPGECAAHVRSGIPRAARTIPGPWSTTGGSAWPTGIRKLGLPPDHPTDVVYLTRLNGWELQRIAMPSEREKQRMVGARRPRPIRCRSRSCAAIRCRSKLFVFDHVGDAAEHRASAIGWQCVVMCRTTATASPPRSRRSAAAVAQTLRGQLSGRLRWWTKASVHRGIGIRSYPARSASRAGAVRRPAWLRAICDQPGLKSLIKRPRAWQYWTVNSELRSVAHGSHRIGRPG